MSVACRALLAGLVLLGGCFFDPAGDGVVSCADDAECPSGQRCPSLLGRCIEIEGSVAPAFEGVTVVPAVARVGDEVVITLTTQEPLLAPPRVTLFGVTRSFGVEVVGEGKVFRGSFVVDADFGEGVLPLRADLVGDSGIEAFSVTAGELRTDFSPPALIAGSTFVRFGRSGVGNGRSGVALDSDLVTSALSTSSSASVGFALDDRDAVVSVAAAGCIVVQRNDAWFVDYDGAADGFVDVVATATDALGNVGTFVVATLEVDNTAPAPFDVAGDNYAVLERAPWGSSLGFIATTQVALQTLDVPQGGTVVVLEAGREIARRLVAPSGAGIPNPGLVTLPIGGDPVSLTVVVADAGGNLSPPVRIRQASLLFSLRGKVPGSVRENPNALVLSATRLDDQEAELGEGFGRREVAGAEVEGLGGLEAVAESRIALVGEQSVDAPVGELGAAGFNPKSGRVVAAAVDRIFGTGPIISERSTLGWVA